MLATAILSSVLSSALLAPPTTAAGDPPATETADGEAGDGEAADGEQAPALDPNHVEGLDLAPPEERDADKARAMFGAGSTAYSDGRYDEALEFFREAYRLSARPTLLYSLAQTHRGQYTAKRSTDSLSLALKRYNDYLRLAPDGKNRDAAAKAIGELRPLAEVEIGGFDEAVTITRVMIATTAEKALISLDGGDPKPAPLVSDVEPGEHTIRVFADGYYEVSQSVEVPEGSTVPIQIALTDKEAYLNVKGPKGATVTVDTRDVGKLPLDAAVALTPGVHRVAVAHNGRTVFALELELDRAEERTLDSTLYMSTQRKAGWGLLGVGGASLITGGILTAVALKAQSDAQAIETKRVTESIDEAELARYLTLRDRRDTLRTWAGAGLAVGTAMSLTSGFMLLFDTPRVDAMTQYTREAADTPDDRPGLELSLSPTWGGAMVSGRF